MSASYRYGSLPPSTARVQPTGPEIEEVSPPDTTVATSSVPAVLADGRVRVTLTPPLPVTRPTVPVCTRAGDAAAGRGVAATTSTAHVAATRAALAATRRGRRSRVTGPRSRPAHQ